MKTTTGWLRFALGFAVLSLASGLPQAAGAERIPALEPIADSITGPKRTRLAEQRQALEVRLTSFRTAASTFNAKPAAAQTDREFQALEAQRADYIRAATAFNEDLAATVADFRIIASMVSLARRQSWQRDELDRLQRALERLDFDGDPDAGPIQIRAAWQDILGRGENEEVVRAAQGGGGLGVPGAGTQTSFNDCAVFALANAAGLPYGVVAARATKLMSDGEWRSPADRANPQRAIEQQGLIGGEVVMLAEAFGQVEVVNSTDVVRILTDGRPILLNVLSVAGRGGHQVVLTKTFRHRGEVWYVMMDSNQGPLRRLFLTARELATMQHENGVVYRPEPGTTPILPGSPPSR